GVAVLYAVAPAAGASAPPIATTASARQARLARALITPALPLFDERRCIRCGFSGGDRSVALWLRAGDDAGSTARSGGARRPVACLGAADRPCSVRSRLDGARRPIVWTKHYGAALGGALLVVAALPAAAGAVGAQQKRDGRVDYDVRSAPAARRVLAPRAARRN